MKYAFLFAVLLATSVALTAAANRGTTDVAQKQRNWSRAVAIALGMTLDDVVVDVFHPPYEIAVRMAVLGITIMVVLFIMERILPHRSPPSSI